MKKLVVVVRNNKQIEKKVEGLEKELERNRDCLYHEILQYSDANFEEILSVRKLQIVQFALMGILILLYIFMR